MEATFWHNRWQTSQTGWHERDVSPLLIAHFPSLNVPPGGRVFAWNSWGRILYRA